MTGAVTFVTTELDPATPGGAGALVSTLARRLAGEGRRVTIALIADVATPSIPGVDVVAIPSGSPDDEAPSRFLATSRTAAQTVARLDDLGAHHLIEFQDFDGLAYWALSRRTELGLDRVRVAVRLHGPVDLMAEAIATGHPEWAHVRAMERAAFRAADVVIVPSAPLGAIVEQRYGVPSGRIVVGEPPIPAVDRVEHRPSPNPEFVAYSRLGEVKGSHDFLEAALEVLEARPDTTFRFVGEDGWSAAAGLPMRRWLETKIPAEFADRFRFEPRVSREDAPQVLATAWAVVIPSRFESFCLAAHEARAMGLPLVVPDLPAFGPYFGPATGAAAYDGTVAGLAGTLLGLAGDREAVDRLAASPRPGYGDPLAPYESELSPIRHARSQSGLATEAVKVVESALSGEEAPSRAQRAAKAVLRFLPEPIARLAVRLAPQRWKDRFRSLASWPEERERRAEAKQRESLRERIDAGTFPENALPTVTVVIPCFNQGAFLHEAVMSVFEQTFDGWEIVVVDDGSTDGDTRRVIDELELPRTRIVRQENRGLPGARNAGISHAGGDYIVPLDADDRLAPTFMENMLAALDQDESAGFAHCWAELFGDQSGVFATRPFNAYHQLLSNGVIGTVLMRAAAVEQTGGYDESLVHGNEDWDLWLRMMEAGFGQVQVREPLFLYRKHGLSMSVSTEARYEDARHEIARRHPDLYRPEAVRALKAEWYPWVTVFVDTEGDLAALTQQTLDDVEILIPGGLEKAAGDLCSGRGWPIRTAANWSPGDVVAQARGKCVIHWAGVIEADPGLLVVLAEALEEAPLAGAARPAQSRGPTMWRRWALVAADSAHEGVIEVDIGGDAAAASWELERGAYPIEGWSSAGVVLQPPEEEGRLPAWIDGLRT